MKLTATTEDANGTRTYTQDNLTAADVQKHRLAIQQATRENSPGATVEFEIED